MTFPEQIAGVPLSWIQQGWRLQPSNEFDSGWRRQSPANRWDYEAIEVDGAYLDIARPVIEPANGPRVYAHAGWGDGLSPTPEMVKVWPWWWRVAMSGLCPSEITIHGDRLAADGLAIEWLENPQWRGPVLPPMEG